MNISTFRLGRLAKQDLADIRNDIAPHSARAAGRLEDLFFDKFVLLLKHPGIGASHPEFTGGDVRVFPGDVDQISVEFVARLSESRRTFCLTTRILLHLLNH